MRKEFDISQFDKYREDNRREVKKDRNSIKKYLILCSLIYGTKQVI